MEFGVSSGWRLLLGEYQRDSCARRNLVGAHAGRSRLWVPSAKPFRSGSCMFVPRFRQYAEWPTLMSILTMVFLRPGLEDRGGGMEMIVS